MKSLQGHFLVAAAHQLDPNLADTVILVVEHSDHGAVGVIVTYPRDRRKGISQQPCVKLRSPEGPTLYLGDRRGLALMTTMAENEKRSE